MNYELYISTAIHYINNSLKEKDIEKAINLQYKAIDTYKRLLDSVDITDYLLIDSNPEFNKQMYIESLFNIGTLYKNIGEIKVNEELLRNGLKYFSTILQVDFENTLALKQITSIYTILSYHNQDKLEVCLRFLQESLLYVPENETIHYNLAFIYQKLNKLDLAIIHYKLSIKLAYFLKDDNDKDEYRKIMLNNYNGIACIFRSIKRWPDALHYLKIANDIDSNDPDINNALGIVYTEMRRTDLAEKCYKKGIDNINKSFITSDHKCLESDLYLNYGHMCSYNGDNKGAIDCYNKAIKINPKFRLPFQNKIMNLNYLFDQFENKLYITDQHKLINKIIQNKNDYNFSKIDKKKKINIGIISGDFIDHPVSFFISTFLKYTNFDKFNITCYSECIIDTKIFNNNIVFKLIKGMDSQTASDLIYNDNIHILFDLAGHTAFNRIDIFALKPSPIQITYIGYPFTTGLNNMNYRITDNYCDKSIISQKFYTEKLVYMKDCFLCYDHSPKDVSSTKDLPSLTKEQPYIKNGVLTIGCFNRLNKITDNVIKLFNDILLKFGNTVFMFKTKALLNDNIKNNFVEKFSSIVRDRINIVDCTILHDTHLLEYNKVDIAIDTFPYSGTTTSCEALLMGVPVFTLYDKETYFHAQNVTASILYNSSLEFYVANNLEELYNKLQVICNESDEFWKELKTTTRNKFINGKVCNKENYIKNIEDLILDLV
jgi:protein O-GlcNAc transferase